MERRARTATGGRRIVLLADPEVAAVPVAECGEPLVDVRDAGLRLDPRYRDAGGSWARLRAGVVERLLAARAALPPGRELLVVEGHRPSGLQERYYEEHRAELGAAHPSWGPARLRRATSAYISPPDVAPHPCGAAVDITLCDGEGRELDLGTRVNATAAESGGRCRTAARGVRGAARAERDLLAAVLGGAGLVNYPTEWWHWSYGDRYWALATGAPRARYGPRP